MSPHFHMGYNTYKIESGASHDMKIQKIKYFFQKDDKKIPNFFLTIFNFFKKKDMILA